MTTASYFKTPGGLAGIQDTLQRMRGIVHKSVRDPRLIALARQLTAELEPRDRQGEIKVIFDWVRDNIRYASDIEGVETLIEPADLVFNLELGRQGDCDDFAMLLAALLKIMGLRARFKAGSVNGSRQGHVFVEVNLGGKWIPLDAIYRNNVVGYCPPNMGNFITVSVEGYKEDSMAGTKKDYVRLAVQDGKVVGMGLTDAAIAQLKKELPNMTLSEKEAAMRIILASVQEKQDTREDAQLGADDTITNAAYTAADVAIPGSGTVTKILVNIGKALGIGGPSGADKDRAKVVSDFITKYKTEINPSFEGIYKHPAFAWGKTVQQPNAGKRVYSGTYSDSTYYEMKQVNDKFQEIQNDASKSKTVGAVAVDWLFGTGPYVGKTYNRLDAVATNWREQLDAYLKTITPPTSQDIAVVANGLTTSTDPNSQALGNGIVNAQNQSYPTYPENTEIPAGAISIVGGYMGATPVRTVQPGDRVQKGETITANVPIVVKNGVVTKSAGTIFGLPKNIVYIAGGSLAAAAVATGVIIMVKSKKGK